ncbi:30359_t:CDS:1, partial [Gigaspora margarita]
NTPSEGKCTLTFENPSVTKMMEIPTKRSSGADKLHNMVNQQVKNKETHNSKNVNRPVNIIKSMSGKRYETTQGARLEDPLDDVRNLFESKYSHHSSIGIKKDEREASDND